MLMEMIVCGMFIIYGLRDPRDGAIRYVGQSSRGLLRPRQHFYQAKHGERGFKSNWIRSLDSLGLKYEIVVLEQTALELLDEREIWWIAQGRIAGTLTNVSDGGDGDARAASAAFPTELRRAQQHQRMAALTPEQREERARNATSFMTEEERSENARKAAQALWDKMTPEARSEKARNRDAAMSQEKRSARSSDAGKTRWEAMSEEERERFRHGGDAGRAAYWASLSTNERSTNALLGWALRSTKMATARDALTAQQRSALAMKGWETRRKRAAENEKNNG